MSIRRLAGLWLPPLAFMAAVLSLADPPTRDVSWTLIDKPLHVVAYAVLGTLSLRASHGGITAPRLPPTVWAVLLTIGFGAFDEWNQSHIPRREASLADWAADVVGAALAVALWWAWLARRRAAERGTLLE